MYQAGSWSVQDFPIEVQLRYNSAKMLETRYFSFESPVSVFGPDCDGCCSSRVRPQRVREREEEAEHVVVGI